MFSVLAITAPIYLVAAIGCLCTRRALAQQHGHDSMAAAAQLGTTLASFFTLTSLLWILQRAS